MMDQKDLLAQARAAREMAVAPSSKFKVGAALLCDDGAVFTGCNIESPTYLGICAERVALFKALSEGRRGFTVIAIAGGVSGGCPPCGACRQVLWEFAGNVEVILANLHDVQSRHQLKELLPHPFDARFIE